jgi:hypothetical protein
MSDSPAEYPHSGDRQLDADVELHPLIGMTTLWCGECGSVLPPPKLEKDWWRNPTAITVHCYRCKVEVEMPVMVAVVPIVRRFGAEQ